MPLDLDRLEQRILGVLIEKEMTVPEAYPLTLGSLVAGCNQKSNREPQMSVEPYEVEGALHSLMDREFVVRMERAGGRTPRYEHQASMQLTVGAAELALLCELLTRGPQAPGALKTRASRMHTFRSPEEVESCLRELAARPVPYVRQLERRPRERAERWEHLLGPVPPEAETPEPVVDAIETTVESAPRDKPPGPAPTPGPGLLTRVEALEREVASLRERLNDLAGPGNDDPGA